MVQYSIIPHFVCPLVLDNCFVADPSGTGGPQLTPRSGGPEPALPFPPKQDLPAIDEARLASSRPVIVAQIPPPPRLGRPPGPAPGPPRRNLPLRSQSMGVADTGRFFLRGGQPPPRFRPPPPPDERRGGPLARRAEYMETSSEGEEGELGPPDYRSWDRRHQYSHQHNIHPGYKTLEPRSRSGGDSLERTAPPLHGRRVLPDVPSHSLPRPGKRASSDTRPHNSRPSGDPGRRSHSHGDGLGDGGRRRLPPVPGRDLREPTPDYDSSDREQGHRLTARRNSDSGLLPGLGSGPGLRRHASAAGQQGRALTPDTASQDSDESSNKGKNNISFYI